MKKIKYTKERLREFSLDELHKICKYYDIQIMPSWNKARLVSEILSYTPPELIEKTYFSYEYVPPLPEPITTEIEKSVRIQRIKKG